MTKSVPTSPQAEAPMEALSTAPGRAVPQATQRHRPPEHTKTLRILPPEGVALTLDIASIGSRAGAQFIDFCVTALATILIMLALTFALTSSGAGGDNALQAIGALLFFLIGTPYYIITELIMNGRTFGKRMLGLRVVSRDGFGISTHQVVVRNLTKEVEVFLPAGLLVGGTGGSAWLLLAMLVWIAIVFIVPARNPVNQRIGDIAAGTAVIIDPTPRLLVDIATEAAPETRERFVFTTAQLDNYGAYELQVLERLLRGGERPKDRKEIDALTRVGERIRAKIGYDEDVSPDGEEDFLKSFYVAQRSYLEQKKLMGDARTDKFHGARDSNNTVGRSDER